MSLTRARRRRADSPIGNNETGASRAKSPMSRDIARVGVRQGQRGSRDRREASEAGIRTSARHDSAGDVGVQAHWQQSKDWFWFGEADTSGIRPLVVPLGETYEQGPHLMTRFRTQDGSIRSCSVEFFERNTERCRTMRRLTA